MYRLALPSVLTLALGALAGCGGTAVTPAPAVSAAPAPADPIAEGIVATLNPEGDPCDDFYEYACGGWMAATEIPADQSRWVRSFSTIAEGNLDKERGLLEAAMTSDIPAQKQIGDFYASCMDTDAIDAVGVAALTPLRETAMGWEGPEGLSNAVGVLGRQGFGPFFSMGIEPDFENPDLNILHVGQGGLGLPDRDYYLRDTDDGKALVVAYRALVAELFALDGMDADASIARANSVVDFETEIAKISLPKADLRDVDQMYHKIDRAGWQALWSFPLDPMLTAGGVSPDATDVNVQKPEYFEALGALIAATDDAVLRDYVWWSALRDIGPHASSAMDDAMFAFYQQITGQPEQRPRWKRCVGRTDNYLGEALGQAFVDAYFPGDSKDIALDLVGRVEASFEAGLPDLAWMDDETRARAVEKAQAIVNKIGYPDHWRDYSSMEISRDDYVGNILAGSVFMNDLYVTRIGQPVDKTEWFMSPPTVNAYYNPSANEIVFPAGILQPPFFSKDFPAAMNYGAIGLVIGHEITHGFDDEGRKFGPSGAYEEWWAPEVSERFEAQAACIEEQYNGFEVRDGLHVNGSLTLGENIADFGGVKSSFRAYQGWVAENGEEPVRAGMSGEQQFFLGFAQAWCSLARPEMEELLITVDPHSPAHFRVNGPLRHDPEFARVFSCEAGDGMVAEDQCEVW